MTSTENKIDFIGIGVYKSGTSWISECLNEHPDILFSTSKSLKEINFFNDTHFLLPTLFNKSFHKGIDWYLKNFPAPKPGKIRGEFSVMYLYDPVVPQRIKTFFPNIKLIVSMRDPKKVLYSAYHFNRASVNSFFPDTFEETIKNKSFLDSVMYNQQLSRFFEIFPKENIHIIIFNDIIKKPEKVLEDLFAFLNISKDFKSSFIGKKSNESFQVKNIFIKNLFSAIAPFFSKHFPKVMKNQFLYKTYSKLFKKYTKNPPMNQETEKYLTEYFKPEIQKLEKLIDRDLSDWYK